MEAIHKVNVYVDMSIAARIRFAVMTIIYRHLIKDPCSFYVQQLEFPTPLFDANVSAMDTIKEEGENQANGKLLRQHQGSGVSKSVCGTSSASTKLIV